MTTTSPPRRLYRSRTDRMRVFVGWRRQLRELSPIEAKVVAVEANATAQMATLLRSQTGAFIAGTILRYDGRALTPEYILAHLPEGS